MAVLLSLTPLTRPLYFFFSFPRVSRGGEYTSRITMTGIFLSRLMDVYRLCAIVSCFSSFEQPRARRGEGKIFCFELISMFRNGVPIIRKTVHLSGETLRLSIISESKGSDKCERNGKRTREFHEFFRTFKNSFVLVEGE